MQQRLDPAPSGSNRDFSLPHAFIDPISKDLIRDPVIASDNHSYDRASIQKWVYEGNFTSPVTNLPLPDITLRPNLTLKKAIFEFLSDEFKQTSRQPDFDRLGVELARLRMALATSEKKSRDLMLRSRDLVPAIDKIQDGGLLPVDNIVGQAVATRPNPQSPMDVCLALIRILDKCTDDTEIRMVTLRAMSRIISSSEQEGPHQVNRQRFGEVGACHIVANILGDWFSDMDTTRAAMLVLTNLAMDSSNKSKLQEAGLCHKIVVGLRKYFSDLSIQQIGLRGIAILAEKHERNQRVLGDRGACERVIEAMSTYSWDPEVAYFGCKAIGNLAAGYNKNKSELGQGGSGELVIAAMSTYPDNLKVVVEGCKAIGDLADRHKANIERFQSTGLVVAVLEEALLTFVTDTSLERYGFRALKCLVGESRLREVKTLRTRERRKQIDAPGFFEEEKEGPQDVEMLSSCSPLRSRTPELDDVGTASPSKPGALSDEANGEDSGTSEKGPKPGKLANLKSALAGLPSKLLHRGLKPAHAEEEAEFTEDLAQEGMPKIDEPSLKVVKQSTTSKISASALLFWKRRSSEPDSGSDEEPEDNEGKSQLPMGPANEETEKFIGEARRPFGSKLGLYKSKDTLSGNAHVDAMKNRENNNGEALEESLVGSKRSLSRSKLSGSQQKLVSLTGEAKAGEDKLSINENVLGGWWRRACGEDIDMTEEGWLDVFDDNVINSASSSSSLSSLFSFYQPEMKMAASYEPAEPKSAIIAPLEVKESSFHRNVQFGLSSDREQPTSAEINIVETVQDEARQVLALDASDSTEASGVPAKEVSSRSCLPFHFSLPSFPCWKKTDQNNGEASLSLAAAATVDAESGTQEQEPKKLRFSLGKVLRWRYGKAKLNSASADEEFKDQEA